MSDEAPNRRTTGWTTDTLKEYTDQRFRDQERAVEAALNASEKAVTTANNASEKRFDAVNEFRAQLADQVATFLPRKEYDARHETLETRVTELKERIDKNEGQTQGSEVTMGKVIAIVTVSVTVLGFILTLIVLAANGKI